MIGFWKGYRRNAGAVIGLVVLMLIFVLSVAAPLLYPQDPFRLVGAPMQPPSPDFLLGTDSLGRDVAAGIAHGASVSLMVGVIATLAAVFIGTLVGSVSGYFGGITDALLMRLTEVFQTIPSFIFAIVLVAVLSPSIESIVMAIATVSWPSVARLVRGEVLSLRSREFIQASVTLGVPTSRILLLEVLPNALSPIIVAASLMVATAILIESGLAFLGLGDPNLISWGFLVGSGRTVLRSAWWVCTFPGIAILITVLAINLVGEGLNDALNPRLRRREG